MCGLRAVGGTGPPQAAPISEPAISKRMPLFIVYFSRTAGVLETGRRVRRLPAAHPPHSRGHPMLGSTRRPFT